MTTYEKIQKQVADYKKSIENPTIFDGQILMSREELNKKVQMVYFELMDER